MANAWMLKKSSIESIMLVRVQRRLYGEGHFWTFFEVPVCGSNVCADWDKYLI
jgi:hypothetical protein